MMLAKSKLLFVVIFTWHFCGIHTMALAMEEAMEEVKEEATNEVKEDRSIETRDELFSIIGRVVSVHSGDTVQILLPDGELISVRLAGIESPSPDDPLGSKSRVWLSSQLHNELVSAECAEQSEMLYCVVFPDDRNINLVSLYFGYSRYSDDKNTVMDHQSFRKAEHHARESKIGLWKPGFQSAELE